MAGIHQGSWFGLPDFGVTEGLQNFINTAFQNPNNQISTTNQGGSNLLNWGSSANNSQVLGSTAPTPLASQKTSSQVPSGLAGNNLGGGNNNNNSVLPTGDNNTGQPSGPSYEEVLRNQINDMYNGLEGALPGQRANQEQIATNSYNQSLSDLGSQQAESSAQLDTQRRKVNENQVKTLADVTDNLRNAFQAGNVYLGARGAGDSSAANQYSYALTNLANKQRGDVLANSTSNLNDIADREASLGRVVMQEKSRLKSEFDNSLLSIAQWFSDAQNQLKQYRGQDLQNLSAQVYNNAVARVNALQQGFQNRQAALESWAVSNAKNLSELKTNLQGISSFNPTLASAQPLTGTPMVGSDGNMRVPTGFGFGSDNRRKDAFGNPIV